MKVNQIKKFLTVSLASIVLVGCGIQTDDTGVETDPEEEQVSEPVEVSNVTVNVTSGITEAVEKVNNGVVSIINLRKNDYQSWASFYGAQTEQDES